MGDEVIRCCVDRRLPDDVLLEAAELAVDERPANAPESTKPRTKRERLRLALETKRMWSNGRTLRIGFLDGTASTRARVAALATEWTKHAKLTFEFVDDVSTAEVRVAFEPGGSWSLVGTEALTAAVDEPTMNFGWLSEDEPDAWEPVVLHEFGHAIGCVHEHSSPAGPIPWDLPAVYRYYRGAPNLWTVDEVKRNILDKYAGDQTRHTAFDPESIMLYAIPKELVTDARYAVEAPRNLSLLDRTFIAACYPAVDPTATPLPTDGQPVDGKIASPDAVDRFHFAVTRPGEYRLETSGYIDLQLKVYGGARLPIADVADGGLGGNVRVDLALMEGDYRVEVRHRRPTGTGPYKLVLHEVTAR